MRLSTVSVAVESGDEVRAYYTPASVTWLSYGAPIQHSDLVHVWIGNATVYGPPALVVELLGRALTKTYAAWGDGNPDGRGDDPSGATAGAVAPPIDLNGEGER